MVQDNRGPVVFGWESSVEFVLFDEQANVTVAFSGNEGETPFTKSVRDNHVYLLQIAPLELLSGGVQTI